MRRIYKYIMLAAFSFVVASCINEELTPDAPSAESGDEVQFGLSLGEPETKTVYGDEVENARPIYWVNGDKVQIFSPQCLEGRRSAEYKVTVPTDSRQNYADELTKTGGAGVQWSKWGDSDGETYQFYSLYPSGNYTLSSNGTKAENIVINYNQNIVVNGDDVTSDMEDCLMYARAENVERGSVVNLQYDPISTVIYVTLKVAKGTGATEDTQFTVQSISLQADTEIAGTFSLNVSDGTFGEFVQGKSSSTVLAQISNPSTGGFHTISNGDSFDVPLFIAPISSVNVKNWKVQVIANNKTYTKTLNIDKTLEPGQIHKITLPELPVSSDNWTTDNWMTNIPRNVYLSEVSIPGSWNALNPEFQGNSPSISEQYACGTRAFHLDTRWQGGGNALNPSVKNVLGVADGGETVEYTDNGRVMTESDNMSVESALNEIIQNLKTNEYMVLICSFAQGSYNHSYTSNNVTYDWVGEISRLCASRDEVYDAKGLTQNTLVGDVLGKVVVIINTEGTTTSLPSDSKCLFINIPMKLTNNHFGTALNDYNIGGINKGMTNNSTIADTGIDMYYTQAQVCIAGETYTGSEDRNNVDGRGFAPTYGERKTVANNILSWSKMNYGAENYEHNKWIYLGLGGYYVHYARGTGLDYLVKKWRATDDGHEDVASDMNSWINDKVTEMGTVQTGQTVPYYPVGIVLMNFVTDESINLATTATPIYTKDVVKNILLLNNKYRMQFDPNKPSDYTPNLLSASEYGSSATHGGNAISLD